jgi:Ca-activated chloride channel family protein
MLSDFHFLRPYWFLIIFPGLGLLWYLWKKGSPFLAWSSVCDSHLLPHLMQNHGVGKRKKNLLYLFLSALLMIIGLAGPTWIKLPIPVFQALLPRVVILDMSETMQETDLTPDRLTRAKFVLHDLFNKKDIGQLGLVAYTAEPFIVSPLTDDGKTIAVLLSSLTSDIMPVGGHKLNAALEEAALLIQQAGFTYGQLLVLTGNAPKSEDLKTAKILASQGFTTSVMPIQPKDLSNNGFNPLAEAGHGTVLSLIDTNSQLDHWLKMPLNTEQMTATQDYGIPLWKDEGRWFVFIALLLLLTVFRRGWLQRIDT